MKTSTLFSLDFANDNIWSCFFFFFLIIEPHFLVPAVITEIFYPIAQFKLPIGIPTKEAKAEMETDPVTIEINISK